MAFSRCTIAMTSFGVPTGAKSPYHGVAPKPGSVSPMVGTLGIDGMRFLVGDRQHLELAGLHCEMAEGTL